MRKLRSLDNESACPDWHSLGGYFALVTAVANHAIMMHAAQGRRPFSQTLTPLPPSPTAGAYVTLGGVHYASYPTLDDARAAVDAWHLPITRAGGIIQIWAGSWQRRFEAVEDGGEA